MKKTSLTCFISDYFDNFGGNLHSKEKPNGINFCVALLREILCNLKPSHELWDKIRYAAFLLNLVSIDNEFTTLYDVYHQVIITFRIVNPM